MRRLLLCIAGVAFLAGTLTFSVSAAEKDPKDPPKKASPEETQFKKLDKDKDGKLSKKELLGPKSAGLAESQFIQADKNKDGSLTHEEYKEFVALVKKGDT